MWLDRIRDGEVEGRVSVEKLSRRVPRPNNGGLVALDADFVTHERHIRDERGDRVERIKW